MDIKQKYREETNLDVYPKGILGVGASFSNEYVKWLEKQLRIGSVSQQRELLNAFQEYYQNGDYNDEYSFEENQNRFLKAFNCG